MRGAGVTGWVSGGAAGRRNERHHTDLQAGSVLLNGQWATGVSVAGALVVVVSSQTAQSRGNNGGRSVGQHALGVRDDTDANKVQRW